jgi:hypothetical protein
MLIPREREAIVEEIIKRDKHRIVGKLEFSSRGEDYAFVIPMIKDFVKIFSFQSSI